MSIRISRNPLKRDRKFYVRGRSFTSRQLSTIRQTVRENPHCSRTELSKMICRRIRWFQPNGRPKDMACREVLRALEAEGFIKLPLPLGPGGVWKPVDELSSETVQERKVTSLKFELLDLVPVATESETRLWNSLVNQHHYLKSSRIVGRQLKYLVSYHDVPVACIGWGDASWAIRARDEWIGWTAQQRESRRHMIVNNVRFLILPWVEVANLASYVLSRCRRRVASDWNTKYGIVPVLAETYVDHAKFKGTCYKAANWLSLGHSSGYAKTGQQHHNSQAPKTLYVLPLCRKCKTKLIAARRKT